MISDVDPHLSLLMNVDQALSERHGSLLTAIVSFHCLLKQDLMLDS